MNEPEPSEKNPSPPPRAVCPRCGRPLVVCYCARLHVLPTQTRVILLQHPREHETGVGTARMAHLSLPNSVLRVGVDFSRDAVVQAELADASAAYVLFPKRGARDIREMRGVPDAKLVVLDGTWREARKLLHLNPWLQQLPVVAFTPSHPSEYHIRKEPAAHCVSTIEALAEALSLIEPEWLAAEKLLEPFHAMVARQQWYQTEVGQGRSRHVRRRQPRKPPFARLAQDYGRLVCVQGEANAWPVRDPNYREPCIVHWVAHRPASGESYEVFVTPAGPLAPLTCGHAGLSEAQVRTGVSPQAWLQSWQAFLRPDDVLVLWGHFFSSLAEREGWVPSGTPVDLRALAAQALQHRSGTVEALLARVGSGCQVTDLGLQGRAGRRLSTLVALVKTLAAGNWPLWPYGDPSMAYPADGPF